MIYTYCSSYYNHVIQSNFFYVYLLEHSLSWMLKLWKLLKIRNSINMKNDQGLSCFLHVLVSQGDNTENNNLILLWINIREKFPDTAISKCSIKRKCYWCKCWDIRLYFVCLLQLKSIHGSNGKNTFWVLQET